MEYRMHLKGISAGYGGKSVVQDVSLAVRRGEIVTLIGENGSGKSTLLKAISRQLQLLGGVIELSGRDLSAYRGEELARHMAVMLTERARPELLTCYDVVSMGRYPYTGRFGNLSAADREEVSLAMARAGVEELAERDFAAISDGQRQRVLLARALCQKGEILVLDEPTAYLDIRHKLAFLRLLRRLAVEEGLTVVMSLHEIDLAQKVSDRLLLVKEGRALGCGTPEELVRSGRVEELYGLAGGMYDPLLCTAELPGAEGAPEVFVMSSGGSGIPVYRRLAREGIPFAAGILFENDIDAHFARLLAVESVEERPFSEIGEEAFARAAALVRQCPRVIDAGVEIGPANRRMEMLQQMAKELGKYADS